MHDNKQHFVFNMPVKDLLMDISQYPIHFFAKTIPGKVLLVNDIQAEHIGRCTPKKLIGQNYKEYMPEPEAKILELNDITAIKNPFPYLIYESSLNASSISIKTQYKDSTNNTLGVGGLAFFFHQIPLKDSISFINKLLPQVYLTNGFQQLYINNEANLKKLSPREKECAYLLIKGMTYKEIANRLNITFRTVTTHIEHIKFKLKCYKKSDIIGKILETYPGSPLTR